MFVQDVDVMNVNELTEGFLDFLKFNDPMEDYIAYIMPKMNTHTDNMLRKKLKKQFPDIMRPDVERAIKFAKEKKFGVAARR